MVLLLLLLLLSAAASSTRGAPRGLTCETLSPNSTAGYDAMLDAKGLAQARYSTFVDCLLQCQLQGVFLALSRGKAVLAPTTHALHAAFLKSTPALFQRLQTEPVVPPAACNTFRAALPRLVVDAARLSASSGCAPVQATKSVKAPLGGLLRSLPPGGATAGLGRGRGKKGKVSAQSRARPGTVTKFSVLGTGYNMYVGFPLSGGLTAMDPGFTLQPVFSLSDADVATLSPSGGSCSAQYSTQTHYSLSDYRRDLQAAITVEIKTSNWGLTISGEFGMLSTDVQEGGSCVTTSAAKVMLGGYTLKPQGVPLHPSFQDALRAINRDGTPDSNIAGLNTFVDDYGTHYVNRVYYGGMLAMSYRMAASSKAKLDTLHVAASISGTATVMAGIPPVTITASGGFDSKSWATTSQYANSYSAVVLPAGTGLPVTYAAIQSSGGTLGYQAYVDCNTWTQLIQQAYDDPARQWMAPIAYTTLPITALLGQPELFDADLRPALPRVKAALERFVSSCAYTNPLALSIMQDPLARDACKTVSSACVKGSYRPPTTSTGACVSCFASPNSPPDGPNCAWQQATDCWWDPTLTKVGYPAKGCCDAGGGALAPMSYEPLGLPCPKKR